MILKFLRIGTLSVIITILFSCEEEEPTNQCSKWEVQINNNEASVTVQNGKLIVDIPNPKTSTDVRLIQKQTENFGELAAAVNLLAFEGTPVNETSRDAQISMGWVYNTEPNTFFLQNVYGIDVSSFYADGNLVQSGTATATRGRKELLLYAKGGEAYFDRSINPITVNQISSALKTFYLDFGINTAFTRESPTASIHIEIDFISFERFESAENLVLVSSYNPTSLGFFQDDFDCNSIN